MYNFRAAIERKEIMYILLVICFRMWDRGNQEEVRKMEFTASPNSIELSSDSEILTITHGRKVSFYDVSK